MAFYDGAAAEANDPNAVVDLFFAELCELGASAMMFAMLGPDVYRALGLDFA